VRYCVNPACPYQVRYRRPGEYQDTATTCSDCGAELVDAAAVAAHPAPALAPAAARPVSVLRRVLVSAGIVLAVVLGSNLPLPGVIRVESSFGISQGSPVALHVGWAPFFWAALLVELAAFAVPRWRPLREDGARGRQRLQRVVVGLGLAFAVAASVAAVWTFSSTGMLVGESVALPDGVSPATLVLVLVAGSVFTLLAAWVGGQQGLGAGFSLVVLGDMLVHVQRWVSDSSNRVTAGLTSTGTVAVAVAIAVASGAVLEQIFRRTGPAADERLERPRTLPFPVAGVLPVLFARQVLGLVLASSAFLGPAADEALRGMWASLPAVMFVMMVLAVNATIVLAVWLHRPARVAQAWVRWTAGPDDQGPLLRAQVAARVRAMLPGAIALNGVVLAMWVGPELLRPWLGTTLFDVVFVAALVALAIDLRAEVAGRRMLDLAPAWTLTRPYEVEPAVEALKAAGVRATVRGTRARAVYQFWGPLLPIEILVPPDQVEKARQVLGRTAG